MLYLVQINITKQIELNCNFFIVVISVRFDSQLRIISFWKILNKYVCIWIDDTNLWNTLFSHTNFITFFIITFFRDIYIFNCFFAFLQLSNYILRHRYYFILLIRRRMLAAFNLRHYTVICSGVIKYIIPPSQNHQHRRFLKLLWSMCDINILNRSSFD